ncbi:MAG: hydroxyisourate hydrolase [Pseudomonadota bacterium]
MSLSTHVLDLELGMPASGIPVTLAQGDRIIGNGLTDSDGRFADFFKENKIQPGSYELVFNVGTYFSNRGVDTFYVEIPVKFEISDSTRHYHVPLLLSPFGYSTYRGS